MSKLKDIFILAMLMQMVSGELPLKRSDNIVTFSGKWMNCQDLDSAQFNDVSQRHEFKITKATTRLQCLKDCYQEGECQKAYFLLPTMESTSSCHLLGFRALDGQQMPYTMSLGANCRLVELNPCTNGASLVGGVCQCPSQFKGQYCQTPNEATCSIPYSVIHDTDDNHTTQDGIDILKGLKHTDIKFYIQRTDQTQGLVGKPEFQQYGPVPVSDLWSMQIQDVLSRGPIPKVQSYSVTSDSNFYKAVVDLNGIVVSTSSHKTILRIGVRECAQYIEAMMNFQSGSVDNVLDAITKGYQPLTGTSMVFDKTQTTNRTVYQYSLGAQSGTDDVHNLERPLYIREKAFDTNGNGGILNHYYNGTQLYGSKANVQKSWIFDPCWYEATHDIRSPKGGKSIDHLKRAVLQGRRARVVFDGISGTTKAVYIRKDYVLFQVSPYLTPRFTTTINGDTEMVHSLVSTDGRVSTCQHHVKNSTSTNQLDYTVDDVEWFLDSRTWTMMYVTDLEGTPRDGDERKMIDKIASLIDVQILLQFDDGLAISVPVDLAYLYDYYGAQVKGVLNVTVGEEDFLLASHQICELTNYLITPGGGLGGWVWSYGTGQHAQSLNTSSLTGTITWFGAFDATEEPVQCNIVK